MTALALVLTALLIVLNAFFVMAEYALVRSRRARLEALKEEGARGAQLAIDQVDDIGDYISAVQVGITMASIGIGALGEPVLSDLLEPVFGGALSHGVSVVIAVVLAYLIITSAHIVGGELVPKLYVIDKAEGIARRFARPLLFFRRLFSPFIVVLTAVSDRILRWLGVDPDKVTEESGTPEELKALIAESYTGGKIDPGEAGMLTGVFHLHEQEARQVMTPIPAVVTVDVSEDVETALRRCISSGHTRLLVTEDDNQDRVRGTVHSNSLARQLMTPIPAVVTVDVSEDVETALRRCISSGHTRLLVTEDDNQDRVRGTVHSNSLARQLMTEGPHASIEDLVKEAIIVPETKPLDDLLADLQRLRSSMAVVIDEYGRVAGIVTVEDIIEEVVGEIADETDPAAGEIRRLANGDWFVRGHVAVTDLLDYGLELPVDTDAYNSVGGFVFAELGRLPKRGDTVTANGYSIRVESVRENRIEAVRIRERRPATTNP